MKPVKIGILGLGTVGGGAAVVLQRNAAEIARRAGREIIITRASASDLTKSRLCDTSKMVMTQSGFDIINDPEIDIIIETIGGAGIVKEMVMQAIENGKHVVTANKSLIALHGNEIFARKALLWLLKRLLQGVSLLSKRFVKA